MTNSPKKRPNRRKVAGKTAKMRPARSRPAPRLQKAKKPQKPKDYGSTLVCRYCGKRYSRCDEIRRHIRKKHYPTLFPHLNLQQARPDVPPVECNLTTCPRDDLANPWDKTDVVIDWRHLEFTPPEDAEDAVSSFTEAEEIELATDPRSTDITELSDQIAGILTVLEDETISADERVLKLNSLVAQAEPSETKRKILFNYIVFTD
ncbi:hypothetical protein CORC01_00597 [Colletotrichum orchidophilum]|uniref:C2H2-type domain-containing protein n=1 Tax=Colletotrichum orchidophilum TaxID=1209926 RepID=A0A1G4BS80_9PEZI|nr:uncharacterized protein CORC01_00597 [Colletotrichum orchidophilum]OHF04258.1 hypothetical protein CORC01_00597 [Colletotrichum orchidophilum]